MCIYINICMYVCVSVLGPAAQLQLTSPLAALHRAACRAVVEVVGERILLTTMWPTTQR